MAELLTAVKHNMNITHVLLNNGQLGKIAKEQRAGDWDVWQTSLHNPDFAQYAEICGALGVRVTSRAELDDAIAAAIAHDGPALVRSSPTRARLTNTRGTRRPMPIPESISALIETQAKRAPVQYHDLRVVVFNGTTKRSPEPSHTNGLLAVSRAIFATLGVRCDEVRTVIARSPRGCGPICESTATTKTTSPRFTARSSNPPTSFAGRPDLARGPKSQTRKIIERLYAYRARSTTKASGPITARSEASSRPATRMAASASAPRSSTRLAHRADNPPAVRQLLDGTQARGRPTSTRKAADNRTPGPRGTRSS